MKGKLNKRNKSRGRRCSRDAIKQLLELFIIIYLIVHYVPDIVQGAGDITMNKVQASTVMTKCSI